MKSLQFLIPITILFLLNLFIFGSNAKSVFFKAQEPEESEKNCQLMCKDGCDLSNEGFNECCCIVQTEEGSRFGNQTSKNGGCKTDDGIYQSHEDSEFCAFWTFDCTYEKEVPDCSVSLGSKSGGNDPVDPPEESCQLTDNCKDGCTFADEENVKKCCCTVNIEEGNQLEIRLGNLTTNGGCQTEEGTYQSKEDSDSCTFWTPDCTPGEEVPDCSVVLPNSEDPEDPDDDDDDDDDGDEDPEKTCQLKCENGCILTDQESLKECCCAVYVSAEEMGTLGNQTSNGGCQTEDGTYQYQEDSESCAFWTPECASGEEIPGCSVELDIVSEGEGEPECPDDGGDDGSPEDEPKPKAT